jgi:acyl carrier protein
MSATIEALKRIVAKVKLDPTLSARLSESTDLIDDVGLDSIEMLQLMLEIEASLAIQIDFDRLEYSYLRSLQSLAAFLDTMPARLRSTAAK